MASHFTEMNDDAQSVTDSLASFYRRIGTRETPIQVDSLDEHAIQADLPIILAYSGYLKHRVLVKEPDYHLLNARHKLNDVMVDLLISYAHAEAYEANTKTGSETIVFPVSFFASLQPLLRNTGGLEAKASLEKAWKIVSAYDEDVWRSSLILIPAGFTDHWVLVAVCNAKDSRPRELGPYSPKATSPNSLKTDGEPFCILTLDSLDNTPLCISQVVSTYLEYHYGVMHNADLQVVNTWVAKCPYQIDVISCRLHTVHHAEVMLEEGVAERIRKDAQKVQRLSKSERLEMFAASHLSMGLYREQHRRIVQREIELYSLKGSGSL